ncbi:MAG: PQQ-dependent sugar dehydrogenase [Hyphomonas sp.]
MSGLIFLENAELSVSETDGQVYVTILRSGDTSQAVTVEYATTGNDASGNDYSDIAGTVTIPAGQTSIAVPVTILDDDLSEATESFTFSLINVNSGALQFPRTTNVSILDDENPVVDPVDPPLTSDFVVEQEAVLSGINRPIAFEFMPNTSDLMIVADKSGLITVSNIATGAEISTLIDLSPQVNNFADRGLLDIALHPDFENNPYLYAFYVADPEGTIGEVGRAGADGGGNRYSHLARFTLDASTGYTTLIPDSQTVILGAGGQSLSDISGNGLIDSTSNLTLAESGYDPITGEYTQDYIKVDSSSHAGGAIEFGPDGALYVSTGDGTSFNTTDPRSLSVQEVDSLSGKILRIDPITGEGLADNPFATSDLSENASKVYQLGLRNPFSMSFDKEGSLLITDTGWNRWEEINSGEAGANFGWPYYEGGDNGQLLEANGYADLPSAAAFYAAVEAGDIVVTPAYRAFAHASTAPGYQVQAITGADDLIDSDIYPSSLQGYYLFTDVTQGEVFAVSSADRRQTEFLFDDPDGFAPVHFKQGPDGYMYYADLVSKTIGRLHISEIGAPSLKAEFFDAPTSVQQLADIDFDAEPIHTEYVNSINASTQGALFEGGPVDNFAARYTGQFSAEQAGDFTYFLNSDDGSQLYIDGQLVIDNDFTHGAQEKTATITLAAGVHEIEVRFFERAGAAVIDLDWDPGTGRTQMLFAEDNALNAIEGTSGDDYLLGTDADDLMRGNGGSDKFEGSLGDDTIIGNADSYDQIDLDGSASDYTITQNDDGTLRIEGAATGIDTVSDIDGIWFNGEQAWYAISDLIESEGGTITGTAGNDDLQGTTGDDIMIGNGGSDTFNGSLGDDTIIGNSDAYDQVDYNGSASDYSFSRNADGTITVTGALTGTDTLTDIDGIWMRGSATWSAIDELITTGATIEGTSGDDNLTGTAGDDVMNGNGGSDTFDASLGDDVINGNADSYDQVDYDGSLSDYTFTPNADGSVTVTGALTGIDTLSDIDGLWLKGEGAWYSMADAIASSPPAQAAVEGGTDPVLQVLDEGGLSLGLTDDMLI